MRVAPVTQFSQSVRIAVRFCMPSTLTSSVRVVVGATVAATSFKEFLGNQQQFCLAQLRLQDL